MPEEALAHALHRYAAALESSSPEEVPPLITVSDAIEEFCLEKEAAGRSPRTVDTYRQRLDTFAEVYGAMPVRDVQPRDCSRYVVAMRRRTERYEDHPYHPAERGRLSPATVDGRVQALRTFFAWCETRGYCRSSPATHIERQGYDPSSHNRAMEPDTLRAMLAVARADATKKGRPRDLAILLFLVDTGVRIGELCDLAIDDLDLDGQSAIVHGKAGRREVYFTADTGRVLAYWLSERPHCGHDLVFCSLGRHRGAPLTTSGAYQALRRLAARAGVDDERFNPHAIRHLVGQVYVEQTGNLELARKKLGHASVVTTAQIYGNQDRARLIRATERLALASSFMQLGETTGD